MGACLVYQVTNTNNGKRYIGYTSQPLKNRLRDHAKHAKAGVQRHFYSAIRKHGWSAFSAEVLCVEDTVDGAKESEILLILDRCPEYNKTFGGDGAPGHPVTEETREKIRRNTPVRRGSGHPMFGRNRPDTVEMNKSRKGIKNPNLARKGKDNPNWGKERPDVIAAMLAAKPKFTSDETKAKQSASAKLRSQTEEGRLNSSSAGRKGAAVRWSRYRAQKAALAQETKSPA